MLVAGKPYRTIWLNSDGASVDVIDQSRLPHVFEVAQLRTLEDGVRAIAEMVVRGAPLIGVTAAYALALAMRRDCTDQGLEHAAQALCAARPTAVNLSWAVRRAKAVICGFPMSSRADAAMAEAQAIAEEDVSLSRAIASHGAPLIAQFAAGGRVNVLTHCNAGWLAAVDWGTALAPIYQAHRDGIDVHVWVDETRPRNQGASLTAWELQQEGVPFTLIADNAGGHLMQHGEVDLCIVGSDRTTRSGDVCNKIGTYLKALAARDNGVPFYAALPFSTIDWSIDDGVSSIPIEKRGPREVTHVTGVTDSGRIETVRLTAEGVAAENYAFDVTPARFVTGIITERGVCAASELQSLYQGDAP